MGVIKGVLGVWIIAHVECALLKNTRSVRRVFHLAFGLLGGSGGLSKWVNNGDN